MANTTYMSSRKQYARPQAMLWSDNDGTPSSTYGYIPDGYEVDSDSTGTQSFIILSDHNRSPIDIKPTRIEKRERMINGNMRSYHIADKLTISASWNMLPSRSYSKKPKYSTGDDLATVDPTASIYTVDGGAGGEDLLRWYNEHTGPFYVFLSYDNYSNYGTNDSAYNHLDTYSQVVQMYITNFDYSIQKRGASNYDMWNVSVTLEEV